MLFQDVLNANSPLPAITDGGRYIGGTVWMLCCVAASDWLQAYHLGWGGRWGKHYEELGSSAPLGHDLVHPDVFEFLRSENWRTCSRHIFSRQTNTFFYFFFTKEEGMDHPWLLFWVHRNETEFCTCLCTNEDMSRMSFALSSQNTICIQSPQGVDITQIPIAGACRLGWPKAIQWTIASCLLFSATSLSVTPL